MGAGDEWSYPAQLKRYQEFEYQKRIPVFVVIGLELPFESEDDPDDIEYYDEGCSKIVNLTFYYPDMHHDWMLRTYFIIFQNRDLSSLKSAMNQN